MKRIQTAITFIFIFMLSAAMAATVYASTSYSASGDNTHAITADGKTVTYSDIIVTKTGNGAGEEADFYGQNAAIFATNGAALTISDAEITTNGQYANAVFSYGSGTTVTISDSTINTSTRNSGGIMVTGGGTLNASNLTIVTQAGSSAAIRSDRGGGTMIVNGGSYTANGSGSPAIYSTADITVSNATLKSGTAQAVVVEGGNTVTLTNCAVTGNNTVQNSDKSTYYQAVMLYQSMSGDAADGNGSFTMSGGSLKSLNGGMFFVTNATYAINLTGVTLTYADDELLRACAAGWGNSGSNGGHVTLNANNQVLQGTIIVDDVSELTMSLTNGSDFTGSFDNEGEVNLTISEDSSWTLTSDCSITSLNCESSSINLNGHTLTVGGEEYTDDDEQSSTVTGLAATVSGTSVTLTWDALSGRKQYEIWRSTSATTGFAKLGTCYGTTVTFSGLAAGTTYYYKVRALMTNDTYSNYSAVVTAEISETVSVSGLKATVNGTSVTLTWNALSGRKQYEIWRSTSATTGFAKLGTCYGTTVTFSGLAAGTTYYYKIRALMTNDTYSDYSAVVTAAISGTVSVSGLKATVNGTSVTLTWDALSGRKQYEIWRSTSATTGFAKLGTCYGTTVTFSGLAAGTTYYYKIRALMTNNTYSDYSAVVTAAISGTVSVSGLKATVNGTSVTLTWDALSGRKQYEIWRSTSATTGFGKLGTCYGTTVTFSGLAAGTTYYYKIRALMTNNTYSDYSAVVTAAISGTVSVSGLKATVNGTSVTLTWNALSGRKQYEIWRSTSATTGFGKLGTCYGTTVTFSGLAAGTTYYYKVRALMTNNTYSNYSAVVTAAISGTVSVSGLKATVNGTSVTLTWNALSGRKQYEIWRSTSATTGFGKLGTCYGTTVTFSGLAAGTTYYYKVRALMTNNTYSNYSAVVTAAIPGTVSVSGLNVTLNGTSVTLTWNALSGRKQYEIWRSTSATGGFTKLGTCYGTTVTFSGLAAGTTYYYKVRALMTNGTYSNYSAVVTWIDSPHNAGRNTGDITEKCSEDGSTCTIHSKVCTDTECTITSKVCAVVGDQKACADPIIRVEPVLTEAQTSAATEAVPAEPTATESSTGTVTEECSEDGSTCTIRSKVCTDTECTITSKVCVVVGDQKACADPIVRVEPVLTETPAPAATEEVPAEPIITEETPAEPATTEEAPAEPAATEEAPAEPAATEETPAEPAATEEAPAEPAATEEAPAEPAATEEAPAEPAATEEAPAEPAAEEVPEEPAATEDLTIREITIEDLAEDTITFNAGESFTIKPEKLKIVPEAADWGVLTFKLDDETIAAFITTDTETIKAEGLTINGLVPGTTTLRIRAGEVEKTVTLVIILSESDIQATLAAEAAAQAAAEATPAPAAE